LEIKDTQPIIAESNGKAKENAWNQHLERHCLWWKK